MKSGIAAPIKLIVLGGASASLKDTSAASHYRLRVDGYTLTVQGRVLLVGK